MAHQAQKFHFPFLFKIGDDEVGLNKGDLGWGEGVGVGGRVGGVR